VHPDIVGENNSAPSPPRYRRWLFLAKKRRKWQSPENRTVLNIS